MTDQTSQQTGGTTSINEGAEVSAALYSKGGRPCEGLTEWDSAFGDQPKNFIDGKGYVDDGMEHIVT